MTDMHDTVMAMAMTITDVDIEAARQLVVLSEGETTTAATSSSGSCNSHFNAVIAAALGQKNNKNINKLENFEKNNKRKELWKNSDEGITELCSLSSGFEVAGEIEDDDEDEDVGSSRKSRRYRSIVELYRITKRVNTLSLACDGYNADYY